MKNIKTKQEKENFQTNQNRDKSVPIRNLRRSSGNGQANTQTNSYYNKNKRRNKMFQTDINMRNADTQAGELQERKRHNKRSEELEERGQNMQMGRSAMDNVGKYFTTVGGAAARAALNHPEWYLKDAILADQNTQISTQIPVGYNQKVFKLQTQDMSDKTACFVTYYYAPMMCTYYGTYTDDPIVAASYVRSAPMNYVNKALYAWIKNKCRRNLNYTPADIIRTMLAVMDVYCDLESIKRIYRIANTYTYINRTLASAIISGLGIYPSSVYNNLATILYRVNRIGKLISTIKVPIGQTIFDRWVYLASSVFKDADCDKTRLFAFAKAISYRIVFGDKVGNFNRALRGENPFRPDNTTARNEYLPGGSDESTAKQDILNYMSGVERRATALLSNSEILAAMADMLTAFESNGYITFKPLEADETQTLTYDPNAIYQVRNATITGFPQIKTSTDYEEYLRPECFDLYDLNDGILVQARAYDRGDDRITIGPMTFTVPRGTLTVTDAHLATSGIINGSPTPRIGIETQTDHPNAGELLTVSRLSAGLTPVVLTSETSDQVTVANALVNHGTEIIMSIHISRMPMDPSIQAYNEYNILNANMYVTGTGPAEYVPLMAYSAKPRCFHLPINISGSVDSNHVLTMIINSQYPTAIYMLGSFDKIIYIDNDLVEKWHFVAVASEFAMPNILE